MVKNDTGGNKGKGLARKHVNAAKCGGSKLLRVATDEAERYAVVSKMLGNGMCYVRLLSGGNGTGDKLCIIRNKFKGRGKRDNILDSGSWVLVGMREWASKQDTCDLLEVYNDGERDRLMKNEPCFKGVVANESGTNNGSNNGSNNGGGSLVQFADSTTLKYSKLIKSDKDEDEDEDEDEDGEDDLQQRVYDMPSSSSDDEDEDDSDESVELKPVAAAAAANIKPVSTLNVKPDHINVDDI
jgi:translation initiation factor IF-1